jgi:hypothetical protein
VGEVSLDLAAHGSLPWQAQQLMALQMGLDRRRNRITPFGFLAVDRLRPWAGAGASGQVAPHAGARAGLQARNRVAALLPDAGLFRLVVLSARRLLGIDRQPGLKPAAGSLISRLIGDELIATSGRAMH